MKLKYFLIFSGFLVLLGISTGEKREFYLEGLRKNLRARKLVHKNVSKIYGKVGAVLSSFGDEIREFFGFRKIRNHDPHAQNYNCQNGEYQYVVSLKRKYEENNFEEFCSGVLLSGQYVLTSSTCCNFQTSDLPNYYVSAGFEQQTSTIRKFWNRVNSDLDSQHLDLCILELEKNFNETDLVQFVDVPYDSQLCKNGTIFLFNPAECLKFYVKPCEDETAKKIEKEDLGFCAFGPKEKTCKVLVGSPFICDDEVFGFISSIEECKDSGERIFTKVFLESKWIDEIISD